MAFSEGHGGLLRPEKVVAEIVDLPQNHPFFLYENAKNYEQLARKMTESWGYRAAGGVLP